MEQMSYEQLSLNNFGNGAANELFDEEMKKVIANINDVTVNSEAAREIVLKFKIKPSKDRQSAMTTVTCLSKLPSTKEHESAVLLTSKGMYQARGKQMDFMNKDQE